VNAAVRVSNVDTNSRRASARPGFFFVFYFERGAFMTSGQVFLDLTQLMDISNDEVERTFRGWMYRASREGPHALSGPHVLAHVRGVALFARLAWPNSLARGDAVVCVCNVCMWGGTRKVSRASINQKPNIPTTGKMCVLSVLLGATLALASQRLPRR
jgi:hypothetical protein